MTINMALNGSLLPFSVVPNFNQTGYTQADLEPASVPEVPEPPFYMTCTVTLVYALIFCSGVIGNLLIVYVVCWNRDMRNSTNYFLVNLSIADLLVLLVCMPTAAVELYSKGAWYLGMAMCKIVPALENTVVLASVLTITAISTERYYAICQPLRVQYFCTLRRTLIIIASIWFVAVVTCLPFFSISIYKQSTLVDGTPIQACRTYIIHRWHRVYIFALTAIFFLVPMFIMGAIYAVISCHLIKDSKENVARDVNNTSLKARRQVIVMLFSVIVLFFVCLLPMESIRLWSLYATSRDLERLGFEGYLAVIYFARVMLYLNSAVNPFCYNLMSSKFRTSFKRAMCRKGAASAVSRGSIRSTHSCTRYTDMPIRASSQNGHIRVKFPLLKTVSH